LAYNKNLKEKRGRRSRLNEYILILALLWIATTVALLFEVHSNRAHANRIENSNTDHLAVLIPPSCGGNR
jgi:preprotein translocase subunit SecG